MDFRIREKDTKVSDDYDSKGISYSTSRYIYSFRSVAWDGLASVQSWERAAGDRHRPGCSASALLQVHRLCEAVVSLSSSPAKIPSAIGTHSVRAPGVRFRVDVWQRAARIMPGSLAMPFGRLQNASKAPRPWRTPLVMPRLAQCGTHRYTASRTG